MERPDITPNTSTDSTSEQSFLDGVALPDGIDASNYNARGKDFDPKQFLSGSDAEPGLTQEEPLTPRRTSDADGPWWTRMACSSSDPELFVGPPGTEMKEDKQKRLEVAKAICSAC